MRPLSYILSLLLTASLASGLAGCRKELPGTADGPSAPSFVSLSLSLDDEGLRAFNGEQDTIVAPNSDDEAIGDKTVVQILGSLTGVRTLERNTSKDFFTSVAFDADPKLSQALTILVNGEGLNLTPVDMSPDKVITFEELVAAQPLTGAVWPAGDTRNRFYSFASGKGMLMTGKADPSKKITIRPNITKEQAENGTGPETNSFDMGNVERVLSKAQVTFAPFPGIAAGVRSKYGLSFESAAWSVQGSAKKAYLFNNHAGNRTITETAAGSDKYEYKGYASAVDADTDGSNLYKMSDVTSKFTDPYSPGMYKLSYTEDRSAEEYFVNSANKAIPVSLAMNFLPRYSEFANITVNPLTGDDPLNKDGGVSLGRTGPEQLQYTVSGRQVVAYSSRMYFLENSHAGDDSNIGYDRIAHLIVYTGSYPVSNLIMDSAEAKAALLNAPMRGNFINDAKKVSVALVNSLPEALGDLAGDFSPSTYDDGTYKREKTYLVELSYLTEADAVFNAVNWGKSYWVEVDHDFVSGLDESYFTDGRVKKVTFEGAAVTPFATKAAFQADTYDDTKEVYVFKVIDLSGTFYIGEDEKLYDTLLSARAAGNAKARKYSLGHMVFLTPLNAQGTGDNVYLTDTRRNNIYQLYIEAINDIGYSYNPVDPEDPNAPRPKDNPDEPANYDIPPVSKTYMSVFYKLSAWNYVEQDNIILK